MFEPRFHGVEAVFSESLDHVPDVDVHEASAMLQGPQLGRCPVRPEPNLVAPLLVVFAADGLVLQDDQDFE